MGLIQVPRVAMAVVRGYGRRDVGPGAGVASPFVTSGRCGLFDLDIYGHSEGPPPTDVWRACSQHTSFSCSPHAVNNASYLVHFELARWELFAANGMLSTAMREKAAFVISTAAVRYRREIGPFKPFEVHTTVTAVDEQAAWVSQTIQPPSGGRAMAQSLVRAVLVRGRERVPPHSMFAASGIDEATIAAIASPEAIRAQRNAFAELEDAMRSAVD